MYPISCNVYPATLFDRKIGTCLFRYNFHPSFSMITFLSSYICSSNDRSCYGPSPFTSTLYFFISSAVPTCCPWAGALPPPATDSPISSQSSTRPISWWWAVDESVRFSSLLVSLSISSVSTSFSVSFPVVPRSHLFTSSALLSSAAFQWALLSS